MSLKQSLTPSNGLWDPLWSDASCLQGLIPPHSWVPCSASGMPHLMPTSGPFHVLFPLLRILLSFAIYLTNFCSSFISWFICHSPLSSLSWPPSLWKSLFHRLPESPALPASELSPPQILLWSHHPPSPQDNKLHCRLQSPALVLASSQHLINTWQISGELYLIYFLQSFLNQNSFLQLWAWKHHYTWGNLFKTMN